MGHTPYGYRIENGIAVIDKTTANQVQQLYKNYLCGLSLTNAAKEAGIAILHSGAKRMLQNKHYIGDDFYPAIITQETFDAVTAELNKRSEKLGRNNRYQAPIIKRPPTTFRIDETTEKYDNPIRQAEYCYSLIESMVIEGKMLRSYLQKSRLAILPGNRKKNQNFELLLIVASAQTRKNRQQVMKLKLLIIQNTFKKIRSGNLQVSMLMMVFQAQTQKNAVNLIA